MERNTTQGRGRDEAWTDTAVGRGCRSMARAAAAPGAPGVASARTPQRTSDTARASGGSALILVLVCLVMMVLLGTAYVQVARVDRRATRQLTGINNMDTVRDAVIQYMAKVLKEDLMDGTGKFFDSAAFDEPYDHAFTNAAVTYPVHRVSPDQPVLTGQLLPQAAVGGKLDDTWLASTYIDIESRLYPSWNHLSNLNGIYLGFPKNAGGKVEEYATVRANYLDTNLPYDGLGEVYMNGTEYDWPVYAIYGNGTNPSGNYAIDWKNNPNRHVLGVDADGDGIMDSRWTWAPEEVRQIGGTSYVVAYRIVDLSSMVNINVATSVTQNGTDSDAAALVSGGQTALGYFPTDIDLSRIFARAENVNKSPHGPGTWNPQLEAVMARRMLAGGTLPMPNGILSVNTPDGLGSWNLGTTSKATAWLKNVVSISNPNNAGAIYPGRLNRYLDESEVELRSRGGLVTDYTAQIETDAPNIFRKDVLSTAEATFIESGNPDLTGDDTRVHRFMAGHEKSSNDPSGPAVTDRVFTDVRHLITTASATSIFAAQYPGMSPGITEHDKFQYDLVYRRKILNSKGAAEEIGHRLATIFTIGTPMYLGSTDAAEMRRIAAQFAANIVDYSDPDFKPTVANAEGATTPKYYGLERMPFLREVYVQGGFESDEPGVDGASNPVFKKWKYKPGSAAIAIEIGNPFNRPCKFGHPNGANVRIRIMKNNSQVAQYNIPASGGGFSLKHREDGSNLDSMVFYANASAPIDENGKGAALPTDLGIDTVLAQPGQIADMGAGLLPDSVFTTPGAISVELLVEVDEANAGPASDGYVVYDRLRDANFVTINEHAEDHGDGVPGNKKQAHYQITMVRDGQKQRFVSNVGRTTRKANPNLAADSYTANNNGLSTFGVDNKNATGDAQLDKIQFAHANHQIFNVSELAYIFMFGFSDETDGDFPSRLSGKDGNNAITTGGTVTSLNSTARHFLSLTAPGSSTVVVPTSTKLPHMAMLMDTFTTLSPRWDFEDNDLSGSADDSDNECVVAGRMNVNTTPAWLLALTSPLPEPKAEIQEYYAAICEYRDWPDSRVAMTGGVNGLPISRDSDKGIRSIGELLLIKQRKFNNAAQPYHQTMRHGLDGVPLTPPDGPHRHYPNPAIPLSETSVDNVEYVAQERMSRFQFLANTLTTRSDTYCAYVVIRGYNSTDFSQAPAETLRFFVILDRTGVKNLDSQVLWYPKTGQKN